MIRLRISGGNFDPILQMLDRLAHPDMTPLAESVREIMLEDNRAGLLAGTDSYGDDMTRLEESTWHGRKGSGPPLVPEYGASPLITDYRVDIQPGDNRILLVGTWPSLPWVHFHATGFTVNSKHGPVAVVPRDPVDVRPEGQEKIRTALGEFCRQLVSGGP